MAQSLSSHCQIDKEIGSGTAESDEGETQEIEGKVGKDRKKGDKIDQNISNKIDPDDAGAESETHHDKSEKAFRAVFGCGEFPNQKRNHKTVSKRKAQKDIILEHFNETSLPNKEGVDAERHKDSFPLGPVFAASGGNGQVSNELEGVEQNVEDLSENSAVF